MASDGRKRRSFLPAPKKSSSTLPSPSSQPYESSFDRIPRAQQPEHHQQQPQQQPQQQQQYRYQERQFHHQYHQQQNQQQGQCYTRSHHEDSAYTDQSQYQPQSKFFQSYHPHPHQQQQQQQQQQQFQQQQDYQYEDKHYHNQYHHSHQQQPYSQPNSPHSGYSHSDQQREHNETSLAPQQCRYADNTNKTTSRTSSEHAPGAAKPANKEPVFGKGLRVGARVRISGIKPGIIRYLGTTHLAPGIFCGIELFDSDGSHDGEVNGHRYFSCAPKHGIFAPKDKVCLDTPPYPFARVYDSDVGGSGCSSTESLAEKSNEAFRKFSEGDIEAVEVSPSSPERLVRQGGDRIQYPHPENVHSRKPDLNSTYDLEEDATLVYDTDSNRSDQGLTYSSRNSKPHRSFLPSLKASSHQPLRSSSYTDAARENIRQHHYNIADSNIAENISPIPQSSPKSFSCVESHPSSRSSSPLVSLHGSLSGSGKSSEDSEEDGLSKSGTLSSGIKNQLRGDNRHYLNFTFDREKSDGDIDVQNTTYDVNVVSDEDNEQNEGDLLSKTQSVSASDLPDILIPCVDNTSHIQEGSSSEALGIGDEDNDCRRWSSNTRSCIQHSNQMEAPSKTTDSPKKNTEGIAAESAISSRHNSTGSSSGNGGDSSSSGAEPRTESSNGSKGDVVDDSSNGVSPEASQTLEWDYGQEFEGKLPVINSDNSMSASASTGTSESLSDVLRDGDAGSEHSDVIEPELASGISLESDQFETYDNDFESIDRLEDFTFFGKDTKTIMTDSGISEKDIDSNMMAKSSTSTICGSSSEDFSREDDGSVATTKAASSDSSQETIAPELMADTPVSVEVKELPGESENNGEDDQSLLDSSLGDGDLSSSASVISIHDVTLHSGENSITNSPRQNDEKTRLLSSEDDKYHMHEKRSLKEEFESESPTNLSLPKLCKESVAQLPSSQNLGGGSSPRNGGEGGGKKERPISLISTASGDTGYAPDTDSELGTLTANTPLAEWVDRLGVAHPTTFAPLDDETTIDSPVDADLIVKESLALSRALCRPNLSSQSSTSNASDTEDLRPQPTLGGVDGMVPTSFSTTTTGEDGDIRHNDTSLDKSSIAGLHQNSTMTRSILSDSMIQDNDLISGGGSGDSVAEELIVDNVMNKSSELNDVDDRVEADRIISSTTVDSGENGDNSKLVLGDVVEGDVVSNGFVGNNDGNQTKESIVNDGDGEDSLRDDKSPKSDQGADMDDVNSQTPSHGKRKHKPMIQKRKRMEVIDHKMPNTKVVASRLADYIKTPPPAKPKEDQLEKDAEEKKKLSKNVKNIIKKRLSLSDTPSTNSKSQNDSRESSVEKSVAENYNNNKEKVEKFEKPKPPVIKRNTPKSKWGNIMSQIDSNKSVKPKPKSEIKSSLTSYLNSPIPTHPNPELMNAQVMVVRADDNHHNEPQSQLPQQQQQQQQQPSTSSAAQQPPAQQLPPPVKREFKSRIKPLPPPPPKIDLSKVKSKIGAPTASSVSKRSSKREASPAIKLDATGKPSRDSSPATQSSSSTTRRTRETGGKIILNRTVDALPSSARSSRTDLSVTSAGIDDSSCFDESTGSKASDHHGVKKERRQSSNSIKSGVSDKSKSKASDGAVRTRPPTRRSTSSLSPSNPSKRHSRTLEIHLSASSPSRSSRHSSSSPSSAPIIIKAVKSGTTSSRPGETRASASSSLPTKGSNSTRGNNSSSTISKTRIANGTVKSTGKLPTAATATAGKSKSAQEIERLESLCEARTKELTQTKIQLKASHQGFDAMTVLLNYCCTELNAFECPQLATNLATVQKQLKDCLAEIEKLTKDVDEATEEKNQAIQRVEEAVTSARSEKEEHTRLTQELDTTHNAALTTQRDELTTKHKEDVTKLKGQHVGQMQHLMQSHAGTISDIQNENKMGINEMRLAHLEEIQSLRNKHDSQMEELHKQHRNKLEDITLRFETIKVTLSEKVESLKGECEDHLRRARSSEEALQKDADVKVQMALAPFLALPKEIDSLKTVLEMRNEEIQKLRSRSTDLESQLEEIPIAREKIISLQQKVENLEAVINIKTDHEKQLHERCQVLMRKCDRETRANKRLSMDYEQVVWRMSQSEYGGSSESLTKRQLSRSPPRSETTSPDTRRRGESAGGVKLRVKKRCESESDRNLRSRSATFVIDRNSDNHNISASDFAEEFGDGSSSVPSSPRNLGTNSATTTPLRWKKRGGKDVYGEVGGEGETSGDFNRRMCQSAGAELISSALNSGAKNEQFSVSDSTVKNDYHSSSPHSQLDDDDGIVDNNCHNDSNRMLDSSNSEMMMSGSYYARSLSGVSDSGICDAGGLHSGTYDSMTGSVFSNDSDWVVSSSANISMTSDSMRNDVDSFDKGHGHEMMVNSNTVVDMYSIQSTTKKEGDEEQTTRGGDSEDGNSNSFSVSESSSYLTSCSSGNDTMLEKTVNIGDNSSSSGGDGDKYEFQISLPGTAEEEEVFEAADKQ